MKTTSSVLAVTLAAALAVACGSRNAQSNPNTAQNPALGTEPLPGVTEAQNGFDRKTIDLIADAVCDRAEQCNEIGPGRKYSTRAECDRQAGPSTQDDLNSIPCQRGIDNNAVSRCVTAINEERCATQLDTLSRIADCRTEVLCAK